MNGFPDCDDMGLAKEHKLQEEIDLMNQKVKRHAGLHDILGLTIQSSARATVNGFYEGIVINFTDGSEIVLIGGGYDGCGDYIDVRESEHYEIKP